MVETARGFSQAESQEERTQKIAAMKRRNPCETNRVSSVSSQNSKRAMEKEIRVDKTPAEQNLAVDEVRAKEWSSWVN